MLSHMSFKEQWKEYRNRRNWLLCAGLGFLVVLPLVDYLGHGVLQSEAVFASLAFVWMVVFVVSAIRLTCCTVPGAALGSVQRGGIAIRSPDDAFIASWRNILTAENRR